MFALAYDSPPTEVRDELLLSLGRLLRDRGYRFTAVSPSTRERVNGRPSSALSRNLRDVFGWGRPFEPSLLGGELWRCLEGSGSVESLPGGLYRSAVRVSSAGGGLYLHGGHHGSDMDAVPFGPGVYRFLRALARAPGKFKQVVDLGCGAGAGGLFLASRAERVVLADVHPLALRLARVNAALNQARNVDVVESSAVPRAGIGAGVDLVVTHLSLSREARKVVVAGTRPELQAAATRVREALRSLAVGGRLILSACAPIVDGNDLLLEAIHGPIGEAEATFSYEEIDPDVSPDSLARPENEDVERLAAVVLTATRVSPR